MATYAGMSLNGEIRESISLDEDDLSDVEDEVFIRDGKNSYKMAEELNVKRPLMAPRRKLTKPDLTTRLTSKPPCKAFCKPCCYIFAALSLLIGIIALVVILVSIFPLPLDKVRSWLISRYKPAGLPLKLLPCSNLNVTDIWATNLPTLTTDSPIRVLDLDKDGTEDLIFGFGTGQNYNILPPEDFCPIFLGVSPPCAGGVIALNGTNGNIVWRYWTNDSIFSVQCSKDLNLDGFEDCLIIGNEGTLLALNARNGSVIWQKNANKMDVFVAGFVADQNNDSVADILSSHTSLRAKEGHLILISGRNGAEIKRITLAETFFMPQLLQSNDTNWIIVGTGSPISGGNLSVLPLEDLDGNLSLRTMYQDKFKGVITQPVLVDITGDNITDIVAAMFNSTVVAFDGSTFQQLWNYSVDNSESNFTPTPGYFNDDNVTDFLIMYEKYDNILNYNYTEIYIIDGKTGKAIYTKAINGGVATQTNGLNIGMESYGFDMFLFWTMETGEQVNQSRIVKLNALNQYNQPPGFEIYNSTKLDLNYSKSAVKLIKEYYLKHPKLQSGQLEVDETFPNSQKIQIRKYGSSSFRHKGNENSELADNIDDGYENDEFSQPALDVDYDSNIFNSDQYDVPYKNREMRSKDSSIIRKKSLNSKYGIYDYQNVKMSKNRLLHDLNNLPWDILRDTFYKNRESQLRKSKFEQRDLASHIDKMKQNEELRDIIEKERKEAENTSYTLWDLESEKELQDKENGYWRGKRQANYSGSNLLKITSVGAIMKSMNTTRNALDVVFITYWQPPKLTMEEMLQQETEDCLKEKLSNDQAHTYTKNTPQEQRDLYLNECKNEQENWQRRIQNQISQLRLGQMTVYRLRIECLCEVLKPEERCAKFLPADLQDWSSYLGKMGDGVFHTRH